MATVSSCPPHHPDQSYLHIMSSLKASLLPPYMLPTSLVVPFLRSTRTFAFYIRQVLCPNRTQLPHPGLVPQPTWGAAALTPFTSAAPFNSCNSDPALAASFPARFFTSTKPAPVSQTASVPHLSSEKLTVPGRICRSDAFSPPCTAPFSTGQSAHVFLVAEEATMLLLPLFHISGQWGKSKRQGKPSFCYVPPRQLCLAECCQSSRGAAEREGLSRQAEVQIWHTKDLQLLEVVVKGNCHQCRAFWYICLRTRLPFFKLS